MLLSVASIGWVKILPLIGRDGEFLVLEILNRPLAGRKILLDKGSVWKLTLIGRLWATEK